MVPSTNSVGEAGLCPFRRCRGRTYLHTLDCKIIADNWPRHRQPAGLVLVLVSDGHHDARRPARRMPGGYLQEVQLRRNGSFAGVHVLVSERRGNGRGARTVQQTRSA